MRKTLIMTAALALLATPAFAQLGLGGGLGGQVGGAVGGTVDSTLGGVQGGLGGTVSGNVGARGQIGQPDLGAARDTLRGTADSARDIGRDTIRDTRDLGRTATDIQAGANANAQAGANANSGAASGYAGLTAGMTLQTRSGETVGQITDFTRNRAGQITGVIVTTADGVQRTLPPASLSAEGDAAVTSYSGAQVRSLPLAAGAQGAASGSARGRVGG